MEIFLKKLYYTSKNNCHKTYIKVYILKHSFMRKEIIVCFTRINKINVFTRITRIQNHQIIVCQQNQCIHQNHRNHQNHQIIVCFTRIKKINVFTGITRITKITERVSGNLGRRSCKDAKMRSCGEGFRKSG